MVCRQCGSCCAELADTSLRSFGCVRSQRTGIAPWDNMIFGGRLCRGACIGYCHDRGDNDCKR